MAPLFYILHLFESDKSGNFSNEFRMLILHYFMKCKRPQKLDKYYDDNLQMVLKIPKWPYEHIER